MRGNGGAIIDTNGFTPVIAQNLLHDTSTNAPAIDGGLTKVGSGTLTLTGNSTYTGGTFINGGTLAVGSQTAVADTGNVTFGGGTLQYSTGNTSDYAGRIKNSTGSISLDTNGQSVTFNGALDSSNTGGLTKLGEGTLTLTQANTYTGATRINGGTLLVNNTSGSGTGSGQVTVGNSGVLGGGGRVGGSVVALAGATVAPGAGTPLGGVLLTLDDTLTLQSNALLTIKLGGATGGTGYDQVFVAGGFTLAGDLQLSLVNGFTPTLGQSFTLLDNTGTSLNSGVFANAPGGLYTDAAGDRFLVNYLADADGGLVPNDVTLTYLGTVVPEPGTWAWLLVGVGTLAVRQARRRERPGQV